LLPRADNLIYQNELPGKEKADLLTSMAILSGIVSKERLVQLINRRKDIIMIESAEYDIVKQNGIILEGWKMLMDFIETRLEKKSG